MKPFPVLVFLFQEAENRGLLKTSDEGPKTGVDKRPFEAKQTVLSIRETEGFFTLGGLFQESENHDRKVVDKALVAHAKHT